MALDRSGWELHRRRPGGILQKGEFALLRFLDSVAGEPVTSKDFASYYGIAQKRAGDLGKQLEEKGLVDRRVILGGSSLLILSLTGDGRSMLAYDPLLLLANALATEYGSRVLRQSGALLLQLLNAFVGAGIRQRANEKRQGVAGDRVVAEGEGDQLNTGLGWKISGDKVASQSRNVALLIAEATEDVYNFGATGGMSRNEWSALRYYFRTERDEPTVATFADDQQVNRRIASEATFALESKELLNRLPSQSRKDALVAKLTDSGVKKLEDDPLRIVIKTLGTAFSEPDLKVITSISESAGRAYMEVTT